MRELIILAIVVLGGYVAFQFYRVARLGVRGSDRPTDAAAEPIDLTTAADPDIDNGFDELDEVVYRRPVAAAPEEAADAQREAFQLELELRRLRREFEQQGDALRSEMAALRERLDAAESALAERKAQPESSFAPQGVSPEYNEALLCAQRGLDVEAIAERCGITVAEAELVCSLARRQGGRADEET